MVNFHTIEQPDQRVTWNSMLRQMTCRLAVTVQTTSGYKLYVVTVKSGLFKDGTRTHLWESYFQLSFRWTLNSYSGTMERALLWAEVDISTDWYIFLEPLPWLSKWLNRLIESEGKSQVLKHKLNLWSEKLKWKCLGERSWDTLKIPPNSVSKEQTGGQPAAARGSESHGAYGLQKGWGDVGRSPGILSVFSRSHWLS